MPGPYTYPGVYVEEIPSGVRTIAGVSTSDTAFVDFFARGPIDKAVRITGFADFERQFGGLDARSESSYAIYQYFLNGGSIAWVVRVVTHNAKPAMRALMSSQPGAVFGYGYGTDQFKDVLIVYAASPGKWGENLQVAVDYKGTRREVTATPTLDPATATPISDLRITSLQYSGRDRYVQIANDGAAAQDMTGWQLHSVVGDQLYTFPSGYVLNAGASVLVHSVPEANRKTNNRPTDLEWATSYIWNNDGDTAELRDPSRTVVYSYRYEPIEYNLVVREAIEVNGRVQVLRSESHRNLSTDKQSSRYVVSVVNEESSLIRLEDCGTGEVPDKNGDDVIGKPDEAEFLWLGQDGYWTKAKMTNPAKPSWRGKVRFEEASNGFEPDAPRWIESEGARALLGMAPQGQKAKNRGIYLLETIAPYIFNLLCLPAVAKLSKDSQKQVLAAAAKLCEDKRAFLIVDIPPEVKSPDDMATYMSGTELPSTNYAAVYFPRLQIADPLNSNRPKEIGPSGTMAGVYARTDATRGVWKAPAGTDADLRGVDLSALLTDQQNGALNPLGINVLRNFPIYRNVSWGARTLEGSDQQASEWKYIPVRRTALFIEESLYQGLKWVVFEPNDEPLWAQIRLNVGAFMHNLFRQGAFQGTTPREAYFVKCDKETTTQNDIDRGIVNILVGFAPLKPAEFVVIKIQQIAGQIQT
jgi:phage tail sheath protein FI